MMKKYKKTLILTSILILLPILVGIVFWNRLPDTIATHFGANNEPNGWSSKPFVVFGMPLILLALHWIAVAATLNDPRKKNISGKMFGILLWTVPVIAVAVLLMTYGYALGWNINIGTVVNLLVGIVFLVIGNYLPKTRQNYTVGLKIPWTLHSEENWNRTHRLSGWLLMAGGIVFILNAFLLWEVLLFVVILIVVFVPIGYSFILYRKGI